MYMQAYVHNKNYMWIGLKKFKNPTDDLRLCIYYLWKSY